MTSRNVHRWMVFVISMNNPFNGMCLWSFSSIVPRFKDEAKSLKNERLWFQPCCIFKGCNRSGGSFICWSRVKSLIFKANVKSANASRPWIEYKILSCFDSKPVQFWKAWLLFPRWLQRPLAADLVRGTSQGRPPPSGLQSSDPVHRISDQPNPDPFRPPAPDLLYGDRRGGLAR